MLTDTINHSFAGIFKTANRATTSSSPRPRRSGSRRPLAGLADHRSDARPRARGARRGGGRGRDLHRAATFLDLHGKRLTTGGAPAFVASELPRALRVLLPDRRALRRQCAARSAIDQATAERANLKVGEQMQIAGSAPAKRYTIVGIVKFAGSQSFGGAGAAILTLAEAQRVVGEQGRYDQIDVAARPGVTPSRAARPHPRGAARAPWRCAPAPSRPPSRPRTSKATSASCAPSC